MSEQLRFIVSELNKVLNKDYNLISFDSLSPEQLLQVVVDVLAHLGALTKFDVLDTDPETTSMRILDTLRGLKYRPGTAQGGVSGLRRGVVKADRRLLQPVLLWLLKNPDDVKKKAYLAKYLVKVDLPLEAMAAPEISTLWENYETLLEAFKETHKMHEEVQQSGAQTRELKADLEAMEKEKDTVQKRIERLNHRLETIPNKELLIASAHALRTERDRSRELSGQLQEQRSALQRATQSNERLRKDLQDARQTNRGTTAEDVMRRVAEEMKVNEFMVTEKLPQELKARRSEVEVLQAVLNEPVITREYIMQLQETLDGIVREVNNLVEAQLNSGGPGEDRLAPFRQQAALVARAKESAGEKAHEMAAELRSVDAALREKQAQVQDLLGDTILRGDELKQYVNKLRAKSSVYKKKRAQISCIKAEAGVLTRTIEILTSRDPTLPEALSERETNPDSAVEIAKTPLKMSDLTKEVKLLHQALANAKARVAPLTKELRPMREKVMEIQESYENKKKIYDSTSMTLTSESADLEMEVTMLKQEVDGDEEAWRKIQADSERADDLLERARGELRGGTSHADELRNKVHLKERKVRELKDKLNTLVSKQTFAADQRGQWSRLLAILEVKIRCHAEAVAGGPGGTLRITQNAETLTFNN